MNRATFIAALAMLLPAPALAAVGDFALVNGTGAALSDVAISPYGKNQWRPLAVAPAAGGRGAVQFKDEDCAFDIKATVAGRGTMTWTGINLCDARSITLNRNDSGALWVDYE